MPNCVICGKELKTPSSIMAKVGPTCALRHGTFEHGGNPDDPSMPDFEYTIEVIGGRNVAMVIDRDSGSMSVTNGIDRVLESIGADCAIYRDSLGVYDFYSVDLGYKTLAMGGVPTMDIDAAIFIAKKRYLGEMGGLFS